MRRTKTSEGTSGRRFAACGATGIVLVACVTLACEWTATPHGNDPAWAALRERMVREQLRARGVADARVLAAMGKVPRHLFVPSGIRADAYADRALPIERGQTISQPYVVALMTEQLALRGSERVLEIGTGSGYQAAVLAEMARDVYTIEIDPELAAAARNRLARLGYRNVHVRAGDGFFGWPTAAPFDAIIVTAAAPHVPERLVEQLAEGARMVLPLERGTEQHLMLGTKRHGTLKVESLGTVLFVPMTGAVTASTPTPRRIR